MWRRKFHGIEYLTLQVTAALRLTVPISWTDRTHAVAPHMTSDGITVLFDPDSLIALSELVERLNQSK